MAEQTRGDKVDPHALSLAVLPATPSARRLAVVVVVISAIAFVVAVPLAKHPLAPVAAFIPIYQTALVVNDLVTALLLFGQFNFLRLRSVLVLACGYLFTGAMAMVHLLSFPGLFSPTGLLGAGPQTTAWLYMFWHAGFPVCVIGYAWLKPKEPRAPSSRSAAAVGLTAVFLVVTGLALLATAGQQVLPAIMQGNSYTPAMIFVVSAVWGCSLLALAALWWRRPHSVLDLWVMVVMCAWLFDIALAAVLNAGRFDLGFYAGRIYGLLAATFVLLVLLVENARLYARAVESGSRELALTRKSLERQAERLRILRELERAVAAEQAPEAIAAAVIQPLRELLDVPRAIVNQFDLPAGEVEWIAAAGRRRTRVGPGVRYSIGLMGDVEALRRGESQRVDVHALPESPERKALLDSDVGVYMVVPMRAGGELFGALSFGAASDAFTPEQMKIAEEVATQLAIAMFQARLLARLRDHAAELEATVRRRTEALEVANRELEGFSYSVSHDLRAPLRAVDGYARMLEEDYAARLDDEGRRLLSVVRQSSLRMGRLIDDLLAFSRLGRQQPSKQLVDMGDLAREVVTELHNGGTASIELGELPRSRADRALMRQVWTNLVGNALKYSAKRHDARIEIGGRQQAGENVYWVRDNGVGFDMRYADKLFGVFQRLHRSDEFDGTGVGLAIVQRVVARHGGRVWAEGKPGEGACFQFSLPQGG
jgi:signal transduction histidine kinase